MSRIGKALLSSRRLWFGGLQAVGLTSALLRARGKGIYVLAYHGISEAPAPLFTSVKIFSQHLSYLQRVGRIISLEDACYLCHKNEFSDRVNDVDICLKECPRFVITFDDGYADVVLRAAPLLRRYGAQATVFVCPDLIDKRVQPWWYFLCPDSQFFTFVKDRLIASALCKESDFEGYSGGQLPIKAIDSVLRRIPQEVFWDIWFNVIDGLDSETGAELSDFRLADWDELVSALDVLTVGSHTSSHAILGLCREQAFMRDQVERAKNRIEQMTGCPCLHFAYPRGQVGDYDKRTRVVLAAAGHKTAVTMREGAARPPFDPFEIPRFYVGETPLAELTASLTGMRQIWDRMVERGRHLAGRADEPV